MRRWGERGFGRASLPLFLFLAWDFLMAWFFVFLQGWVLLLFFFLYDSPTWFLAFFGVLVGSGITWCVGGTWCCLAL